MKRFAIMGLIIGISIITSIAMISLTQIEPPPPCKGTARCYTGLVSSIIDGDTIKIGVVSIRIALVDAPELNEQNGIKARDFTSDLCPVGSTVLIDEDDGQTEGSYGRILAEVFCGNKSLNAALLENRLGSIDTHFCSKSEFANETWAKTYGC